MSTGLPLATRTAQVLTPDKSIITKMSTVPSIPEFYASQSIFITGATGFLGKILVEKLIRSCPEVKCIYLLIRPKKGKDPQERLDEILDSQLFEKVKTQNPDFKRKCKAIEGDIIKEDLGLDQGDHDLLTKEVSVVFHSAATIKFDEEMKLSVDMNIGGVHSMLEFCKTLPKLVSFVHISTAYANCDRNKIDEEVYEPPLKPRQLLDACSWMDAETLNTLTPQIIGSRPNTYTYTKSVAEFLIKEEAGSLPVAIFRPSIVGATYVEPVRGWVDNVNGPTGLLAAIGKGVLRIMKGDFNATADIIPADFATNMLLAVGWYTAVHKPKSLMVFNCTSGGLNRFTWGQMERLSYEYLMKNPLENIARVPNAKFTKSVLWHDTNVLFDHMLPAYLMDMYMWISGRRRMFVRLQEKLRKAVSSLEFFTARQWEFSHDNLLMLERLMSPDDKKNFNFNPKSIHWPTYMEAYCLGTKRYVLKEHISALPNARKALVRLQRLNMLFQVVVFMVVWRLLVKRVTVARVLWNMILGWAGRLLQRVPGIARST
ncbi:fatty acyl-CoA reductase 1-like isoform X2 [Dreissena polymorpha]|uniref:fatty acyl-CoA reductase 1-like isoform X2 n=1 Tax=Dreissena polymorpha TaxID=45954 RepID=UPI0022644DDF|nr:fatty acyl-CoA reductase 1-like isoform X2 [Dreissena polymorpha]